MHPHRERSNLIGIHQIVVIVFTVAFIMCQAPQVSRFTERVAAKAVANFDETPFCARRIYDAMLHRSFKEEPHRARLRIPHTTIVYIVTPPEAQLQLLATSPHTGADTRTHIRARTILYENNGQARTISPSLISDLGRIQNNTSEHGEMSVTIAPKCLRVERN